MSQIATRPLALALLVVTVAAAGARQVGEREPAREPQRWRILVTNDDGIESPALAELVAALAERADVVVCAPDSNRSGSSQSLAALGRAMSARESSVAGASAAVAVGGSPADAACYGIVELGRERPFDLVVSGINQGANVGELSHYSGTVGAAMEGAHRGVPSIAVSQGKRSGGYSFAARFTARFVTELRARGARPGVVYSINVPTGEVEDLRGVAVRPMGGSYLAVTGFTAKDGEDGVRSVRAGLRRERNAPPGSDTAAFLEGYVTVTPLQFDWTDRAALAEVAEWELAVE